MDADLVLAALAVVVALASAAVSVLAAQRPQVVRLAAMPMLGLSGLLALVAGQSSEEKTGDAPGG